jgi:hypothetical protein
MPSKNLFIYNIAKVNKKEVSMSQDAIFMLNNFRWAYYNTIYRLLIQSNYGKAKELKRLMTEKFPEDKLPFTSKETKEYFTELFSEVEKAYR